MSNRNQIHASLTQKISLCAIGSTVFIIGIALRLMMLQVVQGSSFFKKSQRNFLRYETIASLRGNIIDCNGKLLATNRPVINVYWNSTGNRHLSPQQQDTLYTLQNTLETSFAEPTIKQLQQAEQQAKKFILLPDINFDQLSKIVEYFSGNPHITVATDFKRYYPCATLACHILGYLVQLNAEYIGKMGLEKVFEVDLKGRHGSLAKVVNSLGKHLTQHEVESAL